MLGKRLATLASALVMVLSLLCHGHDAAAFCGFYVSGAEGKLFNDATQVVLMREGTRTVLSMQNDYKGPVQDFAMVVPVPVVLQKENVKTLPRALFDKVEALSAPRLVEYWEQDPCRKEVPAPGGMGLFAGGIGGADLAGASAGGAPMVKIEAQFEVGEYEIVILSAKDSSSLDTWLRSNKYNIPDKAEPALAPYVAAGSKFFVAKVNASKVTFENGRASLSPLRFHYDTDTFQLPVKLGMLNSSGTQDLIVNVLAPNGQRYAVANYPEATIPTNLDVAEHARGSFPSFYAALFDKTLAEHPSAVVTEYAWPAQGCDPCPGNVQGLSTDELASLGADALPSARMGQPGTMVDAKRGEVEIASTTSSPNISNADRVVVSLRPRFRACYRTGLANDPAMEGSLTLLVASAANGEVKSADVATNSGVSPAVAGCMTSVAKRAQFDPPGGDGAKLTVKLKLVLPGKPEPPPGPKPSDVLLGIGNNFVVTRLHARYTNGALAKDLVFKVASPLSGGRESRLANGQLAPSGVSGAEVQQNEFQARYAIRHPWTGPITCEKPVRDRWGGPPDGAGVKSPGTTAATKLAYAPRGQALASFFPGGVPNLNANVRPASDPDAGAPTPAPDAGTEPGTSKGRCGCDAVGADRSSSLLLALGGVAALCALRRARRR